MREAHYWDLLTSTHWLVAIGFLIAFAIEGFLLRMAIKRRSITSSVLLGLVLMGTLTYGLYMRVTRFPGGGLYDARYVLDQMAISMLQNHLDSYRANCGTFPTTEQGLDALGQLPTEIECPNYRPEIKRAPAFKYRSDGNVYEIESNGPYHVRGLIVLGTNQFRSKFYIREAN